MKIETAQLSDVVSRLHKAQGQLGGIVKMLESGRDCTQIVTQVAAASRAVDRAGLEIVTAGLKQCLVTDANVEEVKALEKLFLSLA